MGIEIERKFLVVDDSWRAAVRTSVAMRQGYLAARPECSVRVRLQGEQAYLNVKSATLGIERLEFEYAIPPADARTMLAALCGGRSLAKVRHYVDYADHTWEVDEFTEANHGLIVAEIELEQAAEAFEKPPWLGAEVSHDKRYYNVLLLDHPYSTW